MPENTAWILSVIAVCALCTLFERALPFLLFRGRQVPGPVDYLGRVLPMAIIATLIVYCLRGVDLYTAAGCAPQLIACAVTALLHLWRGSTLLSIAGGTLCCMLLTQFVF
ncbi:MAG: AzlD domain-containing protein [Oscillospiraceae bacterium]|nr:AzlD domain-containing protein [Oscillospiraceae bacterium]